MNVMGINIGNGLFRQFNSKHETKVSKAENLLEAAGVGICTFSSSSVFMDFF
jgi:hypothetical protein